MGIHGEVTTAGRKLEGSITAGGAASRKAVSMLLGLEGSGLPYRIRGWPGRTRGSWRP